MLKDQDRNYDVTILCTDYDHWHADPRRRNDKDQDILKEEQQYKEVFSPTISYWNGARIIRLCIPPKKWSEHLDKDIEYFCDELFQNEHFDRVQCHCCQIITASPLLSAARNSIPYEIIMHDAWWMSPEQFLVSPTGRLIDPGDPLAHFDTEPSQEEKTSAIERREDLYEILQGAERRIAVSTSFKQLCENAGIHNVIAQENKFTPMICSKNGAGDASDQNRNNYNLCHIGGMSIHKGYQLLRKSVQLIPQGMPLTFTIIDHSLASDAEQYMSNWNGYDIFFKAPVPMAKMAEFYAQQNALIAPSIWPESFGLVSREAISAGLWVIASDAGALAEPIKQASAKVGRVIPPNDAEALAQAITNLPEDLALCSKLRKNQQQGGQNK